MLLNQFLVNYFLTLYFIFYYYYFFLVLFDSTFYLFIYFYHYFLLNLPKSNELAGHKYSHLNYNEPVHQNNFNFLCFPFQRRELTRLLNKIRSTNFRRDYFFLLKRKTFFAQLLRKLDFVRILFTDNEIFLCNYGPYILIHDKN